MFFRHFSSVARSFQGSNYAKDCVKSYLRKTSNLSLCLNNAKMAEHVCKAISKDLLADDAMLFEASPGKGVLTKKLLQDGVPKLRVFEHIEERRRDLLRLQQKFGDRLEIVDKQILDLANGNYKLLNIERNDLLKCCFQGLVSSNQNWGHGTLENETAATTPSFAYRMIAVLSPTLCREMLTFLVYSLSQFDSFFLYGPAEFYLFLPVSNYRQIISRPMVSTLKYYTAFTIHVNTLFDYEIVEFDDFDRVTIENRISVPIFTKDNFSYTNDNIFKSNENFTLLKIRPKPLVGKYNTVFWYNFVMFVKQAFVKPSNYVVKYYEQHFPGCSIDLINMKISYFKTFADITADEMFSIFQLLYHKPQYKTSIFKDLAC